MNLQQMIAEIVRTTMARELALQLGSDAALERMETGNEGDLSLEQAIKNIDRENQNGSSNRRTMGDVIETHRRTRKRGRGRAKVAYVIMRKRGETSREYAARVKGTELFPTAQMTLAAVVKAAGPITAREIEKATDQPKKTVESCLYFLRHQKLIASQPVAVKA